MTISAIYWYIDYCLIPYIFFPVQHWPEKNQATKQLGYWWESSLCTLLSASIKHRKPGKNRLMAGSESHLSDVFSTYSTLTIPGSPLSLDWKTGKHFLLEGRFRQETARFDNMNWIVLFRVVILSLDLYNYLAILSIGLVMVLMTLVIIVQKQEDLDIKWGIFLRDIQWLQSPFNFSSTITYFTYCIFWNKWADVSLGHKVSVDIFEMYCSISE